MDKKKKRRRASPARAGKEASRRTSRRRGKPQAQAIAGASAEARPPAEAPPPAPRDPRPDTTIGFSNGILEDEAPSPVKGPGVATQPRDRGGDAAHADTTDSATPRPGGRRSRRKSGTRPRTESAKAPETEARTTRKKKRSARTRRGARVEPSASKVGPDAVDAGRAAQPIGETPVPQARGLDFDESEAALNGPEARARRDELESGATAAAAAEDAGIEATGRGARQAEKPVARRRRKKVAAGDVATKAAEKPPAKTVGSARAEQREMLINVSDGDECRIALLRDGRLEELYIERATATSNVGNIYKGRVTNVEASIQAAFVDFCLPAHGFLHISDLHPRYFPDGKGETERVGKKTPRRHRPPIQNCLRPGQEVIVQVIKEGIGTKGPTLSSYVSLPGRFLVMMPDMKQLGVSRKIEDEDQRRSLRDLLGQLSLPQDAGFIVRTAGLDRTKRDLQRDLNYLTRLWKKVETRMKTLPAPAELYKESDLVIRTIRDVYDSSLRRIIVDSAEVVERVREFLSIASPRSRDIVTYYADDEPLFHGYGIESEIDKLHSRQVPLPCGGSLVIEQTEALVAIDVNSGRFRVPENAEETAYRVNVEAVDEIARQLRLRDLGGLIILDLIDMMQQKHRQAVERLLADALKKHKERAKILRISAFGILEMTRQRQRPSFAKSMFRDCPRCTGSGRVKTAESVSLDVMRQIRMASQKSGVASIDVRVAATVADDLLNRKRHHLADLEQTSGQTIRVHAEAGFAVDEIRMSCTDRRGREVPGSTTTPLRAVSSQARHQRQDADGRTAPAAGSERTGRSRRSRSSRSSRSSRT